MEEQIIEPEETAEVAEIEEPTISEPEQETEQPAGNDTAEQPKKSGVDKRIAELTHKRREAERKAEEAERRAKEAHELAMRLAGGEKQAPVNQKPSLEQFDYDGAKYNEALIKWEMDKFKEKMKRDREAELKKMEQERAQREFDNRLKKSLQKGAEEFEDFNDVVLNNYDSPVTQDMLAAITHADSPHRVAYFLGTNPDKAQEIADMPPQRQYMEIARLDMTLNKKPSKKETQAPPPVDPVGGSGDSGVKNPDSLPIEDWMRLEREGKL